MQSKEIRKRFLDFFKKRNHAILESASLISTDVAGETDATLFNTAGMQPLIPYLMGEKHPRGTRLASSQKCVRTIDIDEVGDNTHASFFEMLGNWSLGDYFKKESIHWSWEFLTSKEEGLALDPKRIFVTIFSGGEIDGKKLPRDEASLAIWKDIFIQAGLDPEKRIFFKLKDNWWSAGDNSPCGTTTEIFYDLTGEYKNGLSQESFERYEEAQDIVEIWNNVFMEFRKENGLVVGDLPAKNVDTGAGLERLSAVLQNVSSIYETDLFAPLLEVIRAQSFSYEERSARIIADHLKTSAFLIADGVKVAASGRGYVLRKLIRRAVNHMQDIAFATHHIKHFLDALVDIYAGVYDLAMRATFIHQVLLDEIEKYERALERGEKALKKILEQEGTLSGKTLFDLEQTHGLSLDLAQKIALEMELDISEKELLEYEKHKKAHQEKSRTAGVQKFKGGLAEDTPKIRALHTATHLMLAGLRKYLGDGVYQKGSNITEERTRFDFTYPEKVSRKILDKVEAYVNDAIATDAKMKMEVMPKTEAQASGVVGSFWEKYPDEVKVWTIQDAEGNVYSRELCGGPHVERLSEIAKFGRFKIKKEQSSSAGVRRIKAVLE